MEPEGKIEPFGQGKCNQSYQLPRESIRTHTHTHTIQLASRALLYRLNLYYIHQFPGLGLINYRAHNPN